jgi:MAF protein
MITWLGWSFRAAASNINEAALPQEKPLELVQRLAWTKAQAQIEAAQTGDLVLAADTIVVRDETILGKPADAQHAFEILKSLRGRQHQVVTAIAVRQVGGELFRDICVSNVEMRDYTDEEIEAYVASGDPLDKAGAYAIQNPDFHPAVNFCGCFASVMGLPLCYLERTLRKFPAYQKTDMAAICQKNLKYKCPITERVMSGENIG